jgi:hypothetical protein
MDLPVKFSSEPEVIVEDVARFRALAERPNPGDPESLERGRPSQANFAQGGLGRAVWPGAKGPGTIEYPGVHRSPWVLIAGFYPKNWFRPSTLSPKHSRP